MFEKRSDLVRFLAVVETGGLGRAADRLDMTQPAPSCVLARLERDLGARLFERTALGAALAEPARRILREFGTAEATAEAARSGRTGPLRVTAGPVWVDAIVPPAIARFREAVPGIERRLDTATRAEGLRLLAAGETDLHCGGVDTGEPLPGFLRRQRFVDLTAGIVASHDHPLHTRIVTFDDLARCPWIDYDAAANIAPSDHRPSLPRLLAELCERTATGVEDVIRTGSAGLLFMTTAPISPGSPSTSSNASPAWSCAPCPSPSAASATAPESSPGAPPRTCRRFATSKRLYAMPRERRCRRAGVRGRGGCGGVCGGRAGVCGGMPGGASKWASSRPPAPVCAGVRGRRPFRRRLA